VHGIYGYARVSTDDQNLDIQREALKAAGCEVVREEKRSGSTREGRTELETLLAFLRPGDTLVVTRIDRLARSMIDFQTIYADLNKRGIKLKCTEQPIVDSDGALGNLMINILAAFAQFETQLRRERQMEGIAKVKASGAYKGRKPIDRTRIHLLKGQGLGPAAIAREMGCSEMTVFRALKTEGTA
jgi:DNA invertase Pin-like site-specific DNA recombinase